MYESRLLPHAHVRRLALGVVLAPIAHRIMHKFHLDEADD